MPLRPRPCSTPANPFALVADAVAVYWQDFDDGSVHAIPLDQDPPRVLLGPRDVLTPVYGLVMAGGELYQCDSLRGVIERVPFDGGSPTLVASHPCMGLASDEQYLYWSNNGQAAEPVVRRLAIGSRGPAEAVGPAGIGSGILALRGDWLYFTDWNIGTVSRIPCAGGTAEVIATTEVRGPWGITADDDFVYVAEHHQGSGAILRVPVAGGPPEVVVSGQDGAHAVAVDNGVLYWTTVYGGTVMKLAPGEAPVALATGQSEPKNLVVTFTAVFWTNGGGTVAWVSK